MSRPTTRLGRGNLSDHIRSAWHKHFSSFDREAAFKDLKFGSFIGLTTIAVSLLAHLSGEEDLKEHPIAAIVLIFLFAAPIVLDVVWRIIKICRDLYQQRPQASFRDAIHFGIAMLFQVCLFSSIVMWSIYVSSPHFKLEFDEFRVGEMPVFSPSAVYVLFLNCNLKNTSEVQGTTRNWYLTVHTIDGGNIFGSEATIDPRDEYGERNFIPYRSRLNPIRSEESVSGPISFAIAHAARNTLLLPGTRFTIMFDDDKGQHYAFSHTLTAQMATIR